MRPLSSIPNYLQFPIEYVHHPRAVAGLVEPDADVAEDVLSLWVELLRHLTGLAVQVDIVGIGDALDSHFATESQHRKKEKDGAPDLPLRPETPSS
jgi:hypothetical protein